MPLIQGNAKSADVAGGFYSTEISQSLRFNDDDSAYLSRTPASAGNRKTWTWSGWYKYSNVSTNCTFADVTDGTTSNEASIRFDLNKKIRFADTQGGATKAALVSNQVCRDPSAWYHVVLKVDTTQATASDRIKIWVNGEQITSWDTETYYAQNQDTMFSSSNIHSLGIRKASSNRIYDGYMAEVNFIDGTALDHTSFGEFKSGVWVPKAYEGSYGTNGFYLPFNHDYSVEGFSATTYLGTGSSQYIGGVGFEPDLVWMKNRDSGQSHALVDSVRGRAKVLFSDGTSAEGTSGATEDLVSFDSDGFTVGTPARAGSTNNSGSAIVAWCWDAGTGSPVSNTDGSITSTVKASTDYGFSIVSYHGSETNSTIGHGLNSAPEVIITKDRSTSFGWGVYHKSMGAGNIIYLDSTSSQDANTTVWQNTTPSSSVFYVGNSTYANSDRDYIAYCFHSVSGYSKIGSYSGTGSAGNKITTGFKPAFLMLKRSDSSGNNWWILDGVRDTQDPRTKNLFPNDSSAEIDNVGYSIDFDSDGFTIQATGGEVNNSSGTYIYMAFADNREAAFWLDQSGNNNDFENNNLTESDISLDSPTNNFATLNPLVSRFGASGGNTLDRDFYEGNLKVRTGGSSAYNQIGTSSFAFTSGKWYAEFYQNVIGGVNVVGFGNPENGDWQSNSWSCTRWSNQTGDVIYNVGTTDTNSTMSGSYTAGDTIGVALDMDTKHCEYFKNGTSMGSFDFDLGIHDGKAVAFICGNSSTTTDAYITVNFGQDSSFAGNKTAQGNTDDNGYGDFYYAPPSGYLALCTANLPDPVASIDPAQDGSPQDHFNTVLYTGDGTDGRAVTGVGFQPDFTWIKERSAAVTISGHVLFDVVRGATQKLSTNVTDAEATQTNTLQSFDADGFTVGTGGTTGENGSTYVAWNWKANGSGVSNTDGSITSTVSANTDAGFSIATYTGNGSGGSTIGHGLGVSPAMVIIKSRSNATNWMVWHKDLATNYAFEGLNTTGAAVSGGSPSKYVRSVSSNTVEIGNDISVNQSSSYTYVMYAFADVDGFSKFGSYTGNGSTDGPFVYTGFRPAFVLHKSTASETYGNWHIYDAARDAYNGVDAEIYPNLSNAEGGIPGGDLDFLSNGFKLRTNFSGGWNTSGTTYIYMAFAENPFKYANAR